MFVDWICDCDESDDSFIFFRGLTSLLVNARVNGTSPGTDTGLGSSKPSSLIDVLDGSLSQKKSRLKFYNLNTFK